MTRSDKGAVILLASYITLAFVLPALFYVKYLADRHQLTWDYFIHTHWIGIAGLVSFGIHVICLLTCLYLTVTDKRNTSEDTNES